MFFSPPDLQEQLKAVISLPKNTFTNAASVITYLFQYYMDFFFIKAEVCVLQH